MSNDRIGPYEVQDELGRGGMGVVYRARHLPTGAIRALKVLDGASDPESLERFRREGRALAKLGGAGVVPVHEAGSEGRRLYLSMDLMPGGSLAGRLAREGRLSWRESAALGASLAGTLARAHAEGLVHRDVKPANVLYDDEGQPRLADWGCVREAEAAPLTLTGGLLGTPAFMAPEQLLGERVGPPADVWAVGALVHEAVSGERAFPEPSPVLLLEAARARRRASLEASGAPAALEALVARALDPDPGARPDAAALAAELSSLASDPHVDGKGRHRGARIRAAAILALTGLVAFAVLSRAPDAPPAPAPDPSPARLSPRASGSSPHDEPAVAPVSSREQARRAAAVAGISELLEAVLARDQIDPIAADDPAAQLGLSREVRRSESDLASLKGTPELEAALDAWADRAWKLARRRRGSAAAEIETVPRARVFDRVLHEVAAGSRRLRAALLAARSVRAEEREPEELELEPAIPELEQSGLGVEAAWLRANLAFVRVLRVGGEIAAIERIEGDCEAALARVPDTELRDPLAVEARAVLLEVVASCAWRRAIDRPADGRLAFVARASKLTRRASAFVGHLTPPNHDRELWSVLVHSCGYLLAAGNGSPDERAAILDEISRASHDLASTKSLDGRLVALVRAFWRAAGVQATGDAKSPPPTLAEVRARAVKLASDPGLGSYNLLEAAAVVVACDLETGDLTSARGGLDVFRKNVVPGRAFLVGWTIEQLVERARAPSPGPGATPSLVVPPK